MTGPTRLLALAEPGPAYRRNVGLMLLNTTGLVFVGERIDTPGAWQMPQGGIDRGETPREAAIRELEEEIGVPQPLTELLLETEGWLLYDLPPAIARRWHGRYVGQAQKWFVLRFLGTDADIDIATAHPEFSAWRWIMRDQLPCVIVPFKRAVYEALLAWAEPRLAALFSARDGAAES